MLGQDVLGVRSPVCGNEKKSDPHAVDRLSERRADRLPAHPAGMPKDSSMLLRISASVIPLDLWTVTQFMPSS